MKSRKLLRLSRERRTYPSASSCVASSVNGQSNNCQRTGERTVAKHKEAKQPSMTGEEIATRGETSMAEVVSHMRIVDFEAFDDKYNNPAFLQALGVNQ